MEFFRKYKFLAVMFFMTFFSLLSFYPVFAEGGAIEIAPVVNNIQLTPGGSYTGIMVVKNIGDGVLNFSVNVSPYQVTDGDYTPVYNIKNDWTKIVDWISVPTESYSLNPGEEVDVEYIVNAPTDIPSGGQYAVISAATNDDSTQDGTVKIISSVGMVLSAEVAGNTRSSGEILSKNIQGFLLQPPISATFSLSNTGNISTTASCTMRVTNFFNGSEVFSNVNSPKELVVFPDTTRNGEISWDGSPSLGIFRANLSITYLNDTLNFSKIVMICPLWFIVIISILIVAAIVAVVIKFKKRSHHSKNKSFGF